ncbi:MAG: hypothetical protein RLZZ502_909, partial [Pseudomonadota bacterium]
MGEYEGIGASGASGTNAGKAIQEYVWLDDQPIALLKRKASAPMAASSTPTTATQATDVYHIHADHLNTPRAVTRPTDNALMWR